MKHLSFVKAFGLLLFFPALIFGQSVRDYTVEVSAIAQTSPPQITLNWPAHTDATGFDIYRKNKSDNTWSVAIASLAGTATSYVDNTVSVGDAYEYRIVKAGSGYTGYGYIYAGIEVQEVEIRGKVILVIDSTNVSSIAPEIEILKDDLIGDGWEVLTHHVDPADSAGAVRALIVTDYQADPSNVKAVLLLGNVPVPYSGNFGSNPPYYAAPDAHANHVGAWPADCYYGEMDGVWTDWMVTNTGGSRTENHNVPGDGKFDQSTLPSDVELMVGRIDFSSLPTFPETEGELLARYLGKDHDYRHKVFDAPERGIVDDNFGVFSGEIFAGNGWRNFAPLVGAANMSSGDYRTSLNGGSYKVSYGCGGGSYTSCSGVGTSAQFAGDSLQTVFTMLFGSYFGDWDSNNNLMRTALAQKGTSLAIMWAGRPHCQIHHMGLGDPIGYGARLSQNNSSLYFSSFFSRLPHLALLGDPTLRFHVTAPVSNLTVATVSSGKHNALSWTASPDTVIGYYVYRAAAHEGPYARVTSTPVTGVSWTDSCPQIGNNHYMVRALTLIEGASGSYYNLSQGIFDQTSNSISLSTDAISGSPFCGGDTIMIPFTHSGLSCPSNVFYAELSDTAGNFSMPDTIGMLVSTASGTIVGIIPEFAETGTGYRIRVVGTEPDFAGTDNSIDLSITPQPVADFTYGLTGLDLTLANMSTGATSYFWDFGDSTTSTDVDPVHSYTASGPRLITLIASNSCGSDTITELLNPISVDEGLEWRNKLVVFPNPGNGNFKYSCEECGIGKYLILVKDLPGKEIYREHFVNHSNSWSGEIGLKNAKSGTYLLSIYHNDSVVTRKLVIH